MRNATDSCEKRSEKWTSNKSASLPIRLPAADKSAKDLPSRYKPRSPFAPQAHIRQERTRCSSATSYHFSWNVTFIRRVETKMQTAMITSSSELRKNSNAEGPEKYSTAFSP